MNLLQQLISANNIRPSSLPASGTGLGRPIVPGSNRQRVLEWLDSQDGEFTTADCAAAVGVTTTQASQVLHDLRRKSDYLTRVQRDGFRGWRRTEIEES